MHLVFCIKLKVCVTLHFSRARDILTCTNNLKLPFVNIIILKGLTIKVINYQFSMV